MNHECWCGQYLLMVAPGHNLVGFKNHKKRPSTAHSDFDQNIFFVDLNTCGLM